MTAFLNIEISYSYNIRFKIVACYCINFVFEPSIYIKSLNEIKLIVINLQTIVKIWRHRFFRTQIIKTLKTVFISFASVKIVYTPLEHITQNNSAKTLFKYNARIDGENMQELTTYLAHY